MRNLHLILVLLSLTACSSSLNRTLNKARRVSENKPYEALKILDQKLQNTDSASAKLKILSTIEEIIKTKVKKADFYKAVLEKKHHYLDDPKEKVETSLLLAQLLIQNLRQEEEALDYLENIETEHLSNKQREQYFQLILVAYLNTKKMDQALFEAESILKKKDLTPSERFKVSLLKARILGEQKKYMEAQQEYQKLINSNYNLSKKWKVRSQLALVYESQRLYKEAVQQLEKHLEEEGGDDAVVEWRIEDLKKRIVLQPGGKGRLKK